MSASFDLGDDDCVLASIFQNIGAIFRLGLLDADFWISVTSSVKFRQAIVSLILAEKRKHVRTGVVKLIHEFVEAEDCLLNPPLTESEPEDTQTCSYRIAKYFSEVVIELIPEAASATETCHEFFTLAFHLVERNFTRQLNLVDSQALASQTSGLLLRCQSSEVSRPIPLLK